MNPQEFAAKMLIVHCLARELYQRQIDATDREIDQLVYELYELTEEEIKVVQASWQ